MPTMLTIKANYNCKYLFKYYIDTELNYLRF